MGWIGLHIGEHHDPHCTVAWWPKENHIQDKTVFQKYIKDAKSFGFSAVPCATTGTDKFGARKDLPVALLDTRSRALQHVRRSTRQYDEGMGARQWRPHVTLSKSEGEVLLVPHVFTFTHIGVHTVMSIEGNKTNWKHTYRRLS